MAQYRVFLPDLCFYQQTVACQFACPVRTDARAYVDAIARGEDERAYLIARETNPDHHENKSQVRHDRTMSSRSTDIKHCRFSAPTFFVWQPNAESVSKRG